MYIYQISDSNSVVWHVITRDAKYSKDWKLVQKSQESMKEIVYMSCDPMVALMAFELFNTDDTFCLGENTIKILGKNSTFCHKYIIMNKHRHLIIS